MNQSWYALYTRPNTEKEMVAFLCRKEIPYYIPVHTLVRHEGSKRKKTATALLPAYIFIKATADQLEGLQKLHAVRGIVHWLNKPAEIPSEEIEAMRAFTETYRNVQLERIAINPKGTVLQTNERYTVEAGYRQVVYRRVQVTLPTLGYALFTIVEVVDNKLVALREKALYAEPSLQFSF